MRGFAELTELQKLERELSIEKARWRESGKGIQWDNIKLLTKQIQELKEANYGKH